jgi:malate synthase
VWQWIHHRATLADGRTVTRELVQQLEEEELAKIDAAPGNRLGEARELFDTVALSDEFVDFLTLPAYDRID